MQDKQASESLSDTLEKLANNEISLLLDQLTELGIGRALYVKVQHLALSKEEQTKLGIEIPEEEAKIIRVGHTLPAKPDESAHIIIDTNGQLAYVEPPLRIANPRYKNLFASEGTQPLPADLLPPPGTSIIDMLKIDYANGNIGQTSFLDGQLPENASRVKEIFQQALYLAKERQAAIERTKREMRQYVVDGLKNLINPPPAPDIPPPEFLTTK